MSIDEIASVYEAVPVGASTRVNLSLFTPAQIPDLIGVQGAALPGSHRPGAAAIDRRPDAVRRDRAGRERVRSVRRFPPGGSGARSDQDGSLQRRAAVRAGPLSVLARSRRRIRTASTADAERGRHVFAREGCNACHTAPLYTSNRLTPVSGFSVPAGHLTRYAIINRSVGTDPTLAHADAQRHRLLQGAVAQGRRGTAVRSSTRARCRRSTSGSIQPASSGCQVTRLV